MPSRITTGLRQWTCLAFSMVIVFSLLQSAPAEATNPALYPWYEECITNGNDLPSTEQTATPSTTGTGGTAISPLSGGALPQETIAYLDGRNVRGLAEQNKERYLYAEAQTGVPWQIVAALHYREAGMSTGSSIYNGAALGSGVNVDGQLVVSDANEDAVRATTHFVNMAMGVYQINVLTPGLTTEQWGNAFLAYNRGSLYKRAGLTYLDSPYVMNGYDALHMNMHWPGGAADPGASTRGGGLDGNKAGALAVVMYLGGVTLTGGGSGSDGLCRFSSSSYGAGGVGISSSGFVFPLRTTKSAIKSGSSNSSGTAVWCYTSQTNCHGSYRAADIHVNAGTAVLAAVAGEITSMAGALSSANGLNVSIHGTDGVTYFYTHMGGYASISVGQNVVAGTDLGTVGGSAQAQGTAPHLHFDAGTGYTVRPACSRAGGCPIANQLIDVQPVLLEAYANLPE